jgi:glycerophosphoryl diester phosphodiesterase
MIDKKILNIAHRGARSLAPENTLLAAQKALEIGADAWELDVTMSKDGEMVVIHDDTLKRTSNASQVFPDRAPWEVQTFTLAEMRTLDFGAWYLENDPFGQIATGNVAAADQQLFKNVPIPTLREALELTKKYQWQVNIELKDSTGKPGDTVIVEKAVDLVVKMQMEENVLISSFNHAYLIRVKKVSSKIPTAALVGQAVPDPVALLEKLDAKAFNPGNRACDPDQFSALRKAGKDINVWTVNDEATMLSLIDMGATGLITDFPQKVKTLLYSR